jgi:hypothetical protein
MTVDQNGRDTRFPDAGPNAALAGSKGTTVKPPVSHGTVGWGQPGTTSRATPPLPRANNELVTGLPFKDSHVPTGVVGGTSTPGTTDYREQAGTGVLVATPRGSTMETARAAARRKAVQK